MLLGLSNTAGVLAGVFGTAATGYILQKGESPIVVGCRTEYATLSYANQFPLYVLSLAGSWDSVFQVAVLLYIVGTVVWNLFSTGERILE